MGTLEIDKKKKKERSKVVEENVYKIYSEFLFTATFAAIFETVEGCSVC